MMTGVSTCGVARDFKMGIMWIWFHLERCTGRNLWVPDWTGWQWCEFQPLCHVCSAPFALHSLTWCWSHQFCALIALLHPAFGGASEISTLTWDSVHFNASQCWWRSPHVIFPDAKSHLADWAGSLFILSPFEWRWPVVQCHAGHFSRWAQFCFSFFSFVWWGCYQLRVTEKLHEPVDLDEIPGLTNRHLSQASTFPLILTLHHKRDTDSTANFLIMPHRVWNMQLQMTAPSTRSALQRKFLLQMFSRFSQRTLQPSAWNFAGIPSTHWSIWNSRHQTFPNWRSLGCFIFDAPSSIQGCSLVSRAMLCTVCG